MCEKIVKQKKTIMYNFLKITDSVKNIYAKLQHYNIEKLNTIYTR